MKKNFGIASFSILLVFFILSCKSNPSTKLFESLSANETGVTFENKSLTKNELNIFNYRNFYNGGGVAIGDVNNDGKPDIFFTSNFEDNKLYLNKGGFKFEDITKSSGIIKKKFWSTGVTFADVNADGWLDIYVCNSGSADNRGNELYINNGLSDPKNKNSISFTEKAEEYGLADGGFSTHAAFFDFDRDGDLDMYLLNNSFIPIEKLQYADVRNQRDKLGGDKLFRNDNNKFVDISEEAGIYGGINGFGLGITIGDVNNDNWLDIYISNDFYERDFLYINQKNGKFKESIKDYLPYTSLSSMGADIADINNDGNLDIFITEMLPNNDKRLKSTMIFESYELMRLKQDRDFYHQFSRNMLHVNNGDDTFTEVGQAAGVEATDWSWGALMFDMNNDGNKDIFVANGILKDLTDQDFIMFLGDNPDARLMIEGKKKFDFTEFVNKMNSTPLANFAFENTGSANISFKNKATDWGLDDPSFSNGSAYGDLDNDGDLDLVVNNNDSPASIFRNLSTQKLKANYLKVKLKGLDKNSNAIGTKVYTYSKGKTQFLQQMPNRGFQSSVDLNLNFGFDKAQQIDSLIVIWPNDKKQIIFNPKLNQDLVLDIKNANLWFHEKVKTTTPTFTDITAQSLNYVHTENDFVDYNRDGTLKRLYSTEGPALSTGDLNGDGLDDLFFGGALNQVSKVFIQSANNKFVERKQPELEKRIYTEDVASCFFDADGDKDLDLYIATGGNEYLPESAELIDFIYYNDGKGNFTKSISLPESRLNNSCVVANDFDRDGDMDLFVGSRIISSKVGDNTQQSILVNNGNGNFSQLKNNKLNNIGMVTDAKWIDINKDGYDELVMVGDWMDITIIYNIKGKLNFENISTVKNSKGWWNRLQNVDIDNDGDQDIIIGNLGINSRLKASIDHPANLYSNDYDKNGNWEQIMTCFRSNQECLLMQRSDLVKQLPKLKAKFTTHEAYSKAGFSDLFSSSEREGEKHYVVNEANSVIMINDGKGNFEIQPLPYEAQLSPIYGIVTGDFNNDSKMDVLLSGNFYDNLPEYGRYDGNYGLLLEGTGKGKFKVLKSNQTGFLTKGQVRVMKMVKNKLGQDLVILAKNSTSAQVFLKK